MSTLTKESPSERCLRLSYEYEILNIPEQVHKHFRNLIKLDETNDANIFMYCKFCLRNQQYKLAE